MSLEEHALRAQIIGMTPHALAMWTVYDRPTDYPNSYVARRFDIGDGGAEPQPTESIIITADLETLRNILAWEMHLTCLARSPGDDPRIVETWL